MKKLYYDVLTRKEDGYKSRFFTAQDFVNIIKNSFMSYNDFVMQCHKSIPNDKDRQYLVKNIAAFHNSNLFSEDRAKMIIPILENSNKLVYSNLFDQKILNFQGNNKTMFDFYINGQSGLLIDPQEEEGENIRHQNKNVPEGNLIIRVINYRSVNRIPTADYVDMDTYISFENNMLYDSQMRSVPWYVDEWINVHELKMERGKEVYAMSPLLQHCVRIYDKMLLLSKQKQSYVYPALLRNSIKASFNDLRIIKDMNKRYQLINDSYIRIVPYISKKDDTGSIREISRFFKYSEQQFKGNAYSYADVIANGSGTSGFNKIDVDDYQRAAFQMGLLDIVFTKEQNTTAGLFAWLNPDFAKIKLEYENLITRPGPEVLNNHMIAIDHKNQQYVTAIKGEITPIERMQMDSSKRNAFVKKYNQRHKHHNSKTYLYDVNDSYTQSMIVKDLDGTSTGFSRDINYLHNSKVIHHPDDKDDKDTYDTAKSAKTRYTRNALVAIVSNNIDLPSVKELMDLDIDKLAEWMYSLRGVACEGFFNKEFLKQRMVVKRTKRLKFAAEDTSPEFQKMLFDRENFIKMKFNRKDHQDKFIAREYMNCMCSGKIINNTCRICNNPRPEDGVIHKDLWIDNDKEFDTVKIDSFAIVEDGINVHLEYSIPLSNSRFKCEELSKNVPVETAQYSLGYLKELNLGDIEHKNLNVPLDGVYYGLGGFKSGIYGIGFALIRLYNAMKGEIEYSSEDIFKNPQLIRDLLSKFKKSLIRTEMYDKKQKKYIMKDVEAWVVMLAVSPTEVSQEYNKSKTEEEKSFGKTNYVLNNALGFTDLNNALCEESLITTGKDFALRNEYLKIANIHSSFRPSVLETDKAKNLAIKHDNLIKGIPNLTGQFLNQSSIFDIRGFNKYSLRDYISYDEYLYVKDNYPLFNEKKFEDGFVIHCSLGLSREEAVHYNQYGVIEHSIYFPPKKFLLSMFEIVGDNNVRVNSVLSTYISIFETLAVSKLGSATKGDNRSNIQLLNKNNSSYMRYFNQINGRILDSVNDLLFGKSGIFNQSTNIAVPRIMSKQLTCIDCPFDAAIVGSKRNFKRIASKVFSKKFPERKQDWSIEYDEKGGYKQVGWCWLEDIYCIAVREPVLFGKQNLNIKSMWSSVKADIEYKKAIGKTFSQKHPKSKGIYLNPVFVALLLEGDVDGDTIFLKVPQTERSQEELEKVYHNIKDLKFFDKNNDNPIAQLVRKTYLVPSLNYLLDEAESLNFELDVPIIGYSTISFGESLSANFQASNDSENIGFTTISSWFGAYFIDFYRYNYESFIERGYQIPELTNEDVYDLLFIFQYLLAQQNGVRAMKTDAPYGKITIDSLITDQTFGDNDFTSRALLKILVNEYKEDNASKGIEIDLAPVLDKLYQIFDNFFISEGKFKGFGYMRTIEGKVFSYKSQEWGYGNKKAKDGIAYDCTNRFDKTFIDFQACFLMINGRNLDTFIDKFGYDVTLKALEFGNKPHLHSPLLSFAKTVFLK